MNNGSTGRDALGSAQFFVGEHRSVADHKSVTAVALTLAALFLACTVYARWWSGRASISNTLPDAKLRAEVNPLRVAPLHDAMRPNFTWWVVGTLIAVFVFYESAAHKVTMDTKCACGTERHTLKVAVVREAGSWPISPTRNNLLKRHA